MTMLQANIIKFILKMTIRYTISFVPLFEQNIYKEIETLTESIKITPDGNDLSFEAE